MRLVASAQSMNQVRTSRDVVYGMAEELVETVEKMRRMLEEGGS
jgi:hypothetical protein